MLRKQNVIREIKVKKHKKSRKEKNQKPLSPVRKALITIKNVFCWTVIAIFAFILVSFLLTRISGGVPTIFGYTFQRVSSGSMEPVLSVGDIILSKEISSPDEITVNDIVSFKGDARFSYHMVTHRVIAMPEISESGETFIITKGDANDIADGEIPIDSVKYIYICKLGFFNAVYSLFLSPWGLIIFIGLLLFIFFDELLNVVRIVSGNYPDEEEESIAEIMERIQREDREKEEAKKRLTEKKSKDTVQVMAEAEPENDTDENAEDKTDETSE